MTALGTAVRDARGLLLAHCWHDSRGQCWATGYSGRGMVRVPTQGPHPTREAALGAVGVLEEAPGRGRVIPC